jgi:acetoin utilization protein AcuB
VERGAIVEIKIAQRDYSLAEVSRLIESNGVKIISSYYHTPQVGDVITDSYLTLKLNQSDIAASLATLERFGYNITGVYAHDPIENIDQERLDSLLRYLAT